MRDLVARHQVVTIIGARGTGKTTIINDLLADWQRTETSVLALDGRSLVAEEDIAAPLAEALGCLPDRLDAASFDGVLRLVVDSCDALVDRGWLATFQERLRALLATPSARGRVVVVLLGRPQFRSLAGGAASPLLNLGPVATTRPLTASEIAESFEVHPSVAGLARDLTGGHPALTRMLFEYPHESPDELAQFLDEFVKANQRYLLHLVEDHSVAATDALGSLLADGTAVNRAVLIGRHFGQGISTSGIEALSDLEASGLVSTDGDDCVAVSARLLNVGNLSSFLHSPTPEVPAGPASDEFSRACALLWWYENRLREAVVESLAPADPAWWPSLIPPEIATGAEARRSNEMAGPVPSTDRGHPILFVSLAELFQIIQARNNWREIFRVALGRTATVVEEAGRVMTAVRNKVAHNRPLSANDVAQLSAAAARLGLEGPPDSSSSDRDMCG